jgi:hypothetical protein
MRLVASRKSLDGSHPSSTSWSARQWQRSQSSIERLLPHGRMFKRCAQASGIAGTGVGDGYDAKEAASGTRGGAQERLARMVVFACILAVPRPTGMLRV